MTYHWQWHLIARGTLILALQAVIWLKFGAIPPIEIASLIIMAIGVIQIADATNSIDVGTTPGFYPLTDQICQKQLWVVSLLYLWAHRSELITILS